MPSPTGTSVVCGEHGRRAGDAPGEEVVLRQPQLAEAELLGRRRATVGMSSGGRRAPRERGRQVVFRLTCRRLSGRCWLAVERVENVRRRERDVVDRLADRVSRRVDEVHSAHLTCSGVIGSSDRVAGRSSLLCTLARERLAGRRSSEDRLVHLYPRFIMGSESSSGVLGVTQLPAGTVAFLFITGPRSGGRDLRGSDPGGRVNSHVRTRTARRSSRVPTKGVGVSRIARTVCG